MELFDLIKRQKHCTYATGKQSPTQGVSSPRRSCALAFLQFFDNKYQAFLTEVQSEMCAGAETAGAL